MTDRQIAWIQVVGGFAVLVVGVFAFRGLVEIVAAVVGVMIGIQGLQRLRRP